jgi:mannose-1-phosphate guanylyltransferase
VDSGGRQPHAIVLAGSYAWSGSPLERLVPRALLPVAHEPLITYVLRWLEAAGLEKATICLNSDARAARTRLDRDFRVGIEIDYAEDAMPRGPAGCARDAAFGHPAPAYVVADATLVPCFDLARLLEAHHGSGAAATVAVQEEPSTEGAPRLVPAGVYVFGARALASVPAVGFHDIKESLLPLLYRAGEPVHAYRVEAASPRVTGPASYLEVSRWAVRRLVGAARPRSGYLACGDVHVHRDARVAGDARLAGPVLVGPDSVIMAGATLIGPTIVGAGCRVAPGAVVARTVLWDRCVVGADALADACVLGDDAEVAAHAQLTGLVEMPEPHPAGARRPMRARVLQVAFPALRPDTAMR